jgi:hypothetical protein
MADTPFSTVAINLPADLVAKMEDLKKDRADDREKTVEELVHELCQCYVSVREMARWEATHQDELNRSYAADPNLWDDAPLWEAEYRRMEEQQP